MKNINRFFITVFTIFIPIVFAPKLKGESKQPLDTTANSLLETVSLHIKPWEKPTLTSSKEQLSGINDTRNTFYYLGFRASENTGYIIINAAKKDPVVEEFSLAGNPFEILSDEAVLIAQRAAGIDRTLRKPRTIYLGPSFFFLNYPFDQSEKALGEVLVDIIDRKIVNISSPRKGTDIKTVINAQKTSFNCLSDLEIYPYYISNEIVCIAMIFSYWEGKGFSNLRQASLVDPKRRESVHEFMAEIAKSCEKCTHISGIEIFSSSRGYYTETKYFLKYPTQKNKLQATFEIIKKEILQKRPLFIQINSAGIVHTVVGIGFLETPYGRFVVTVIPGMNIHQDIINNAFFYNWDGDFDNLSITTIKPLPISISNLNKSKE